MATQGTEAVSFKPASAFAELADRWIYVWMAALFLVTVLVGFTPSSLGQINEIRTGGRAPFSGFTHFHALMMGSWITLLLVQSTLMATGRRSFHMKLGMVSVFLIPAVVISMVGVAGASYTQDVLANPGATPEFGSNILLGQIRTVFLFSTLTFWAILVRKDDPETHKRLLFIATIPPLSAAIDRIGWLRAIGPEQPLFMDITQLAWLAPLLIYDLWRRGKLHKAYVIGIALNLPFIAFTHIAWGTDWWLATAPKVFGVYD